MAWQALYSEKSHIFCFKNTGRSRLCSTTETVLMKRYASVFSTFFLTAFLALTTQAQGTHTVIVDQPNSPIALSEYAAEYQERNSYQSEGVRHDVNTKNISNRSIVAFELGFAMFSVFNEFMDTSSGVSMDGLDAGDDDDGAWVANSLNAFTFHTGVAFVRQLRYENGDVWAADMSVVEERIQKIQSEFDASQLEKDGGESE